MNVDEANGTVHVEPVMRTPPRTSASSAVKPSGKSTAEIGVIGGSGVYEMDGLRKVRKAALRTPFGRPSDAYVLGELNGRRLAFLPRHGVGHRLLPTELNFRANVYGMKMLGVTHIISISAVGSMKEHLQPGQIVVPTQFLDRTTSRPRTFFGDGIVAHVAFADPVCSPLVETLVQAGRRAGATIYKGGTYICIEGPQFSTRAESKLFRSWEVDVIGMTNLPEARLAREAEICYATLALVTDYDCWHETEEDVNVEGVLAVLRKNADMARAIVRNAVDILPDRNSCACATALKDSILTAPEKIPAATRKKLGLLVNRYLSKQPGPDGTVQPKSQKPK